MKPNRLRTGILFIGLGLALLLYNMDRLDSWYFLDLLNLWPVLLVAIGVEIISRHSNAPMLGYVSPLLIAGAFVYAGYAGQNGFDRSWQFSWSDDEQPRWRTVDQTFETDNPVDEARIYVDMYHGDLNIKGGCADLGNGEFRAAGRVLTSIAEDESRAIIRIRQSGAHRHERAEFDLALTETLPLTLDLKAEDADIDLDAASLMIHKLYLDIADGTAAMTLGRAADSLWASLSTGDARLLLRLPAEAGIRLLGGEVPSGADLGPFILMPVDSGLETADYAESAFRVILVMEKPVKRMKLETY